MTVEALTNAVRHSAGSLRPDRAEGREGPGGGDGAGRRPGVRSGSRGAPSSPRRPGPAGDQPAGALARWGRFGSQPARLRNARPDFNSDSSPYRHSGRADANLARTAGGQDVNERTRVLLIDDHEMARRGLRAMLVRGRLDRGRRARAIPAESGLEARGEPPARHGPAGHPHAGHGRAGLPGAAQGQLGRGSPSSS